MIAYFDPAQLQHEPRFFLSSGAPQPNPEVAARAQVLQAALRLLEVPLKAPGAWGLGPVAAVHTAEYLNFLKHIYRRWQYIPGGSEEVIPNIHPNRQTGGYPDSAVGQAGWHLFDTACPIGPETWESALASANTAVAAAREVCQHHGVAYALCRPPGHHAHADMAGGFCYLNNTAIAARALSAHFARVAIVDIDLHHGNGTQSIFYHTSEVLTISLHADPARFYPFYWGHAHERGSGPGEGFNLNLPLPRGTADAEYLKALDKALDRLEVFAPESLVVALGLDAHEGDPLAGLAVTTDGFRQIGQRLGALKLPTVLVQEGGYLSEALGDNLIHFLKGFSC